MDEKNTYTDIYDGSFTERDGVDYRHLPQHVDNKKIESKKPLNANTVTYTDIYNGYVDYEGEEKV